MGATGVLAGVVIPAHDEQAVIGRCLAALAEGTRPGELDIVVVANDCADETAAIAKAAGATVIETPVGGKANALRLGDAQCHTFPRLYLDADSELTGDTVRRMVAALAQTGAPACAPTPEFDLTGAGRIVLGFHRSLRALLADRDSLAGAGAYLLTQVGHDRVFPLPDIIADDGWVHRTFSPDERLVVAGARAVVRPPRTIGAVIRARARIRHGNQQLARHGRPATEPPLRSAALRSLVRAGTVTPVDAACFAVVLVTERAVARWRAARGRNDTWSTDQSSRS